jgi:hypothetical protein
MTNAKAAQCAFCHQPLRAEAVAAPSKNASGASKDTAPAGAPKCANCGYDLSSLRASRCPECGRLIRPKSDPTRISGEPEVREDVVHAGVILLGGLLFLLFLCATRFSPVKRVGIEAGCFVIFGTLTALCVYGVEKICCADDLPRPVVIMRSLAAYAYTRIAGFMFLAPSVWRTPYLPMFLLVALIVATAMIFWLWDDQTFKDAVVRALVVLAFATGPPALVLHLA